MKLAFFALMMIAFTACTGGKNHLAAADKDNYLASGDLITADAQKILMQNVAQAIKSGGVSNAVEFCNEQAIPLTDSLSKTHVAEIQRLSDKNRNPANAIKTDLDKRAWVDIKTLMGDSAETKHLILKENDDVYYYKAISIGMPTCLKCHGDKTFEIDPKVLQMISQKYPNDKATDYKMGDLRGMWKVKLN